MANFELITVKNALASESNRVAKAMDEVCHLTALDVMQDISESFDTPKSGRAYNRGSSKGRGKGGKRGKRGRRSNTRIHIASAPGEAPAVDYGNLKNSISKKPSSPKGTREVYVVVGAEYGAALEFGITRMAPRPFLDPAMRGNQENFEENMRRVLLGSLSE